METIRITKEFHFEMAHALKDYDGACRNIHGHSYRLLVTLRGQPITDSRSPKYGMVLDFQELKSIVKKPVVDMFDHSLILNAAVGEKMVSKLGEHYAKVYVFDFQPTCENLCIYIAGIIKEKLPPGIQLYSLKLYETASSYAEWFAEDNPQS